MYFARLRIKGKLVRKSLKTETLSVAKLRLADLEKLERQRAEMSGDAAKGKLVFGRPSEPDKVKADKTSIPASPGHGLRISACAASKATRL